MSLSDVLIYSVNHFCSYVSFLPSNIVFNSGNKFFQAGRGGCGYQAAPFPHNFMAPPLLYPAATPVQQ